jgi:hypothetical protein
MMMMPVEGKIVTIMMVMTYDSIDFALINAWHYSAITTI